MSTQKRVALQQLIHQKLRLQQSRTSEAVETKNKNWVAPKLFIIVLALVFAILACQWFGDDVPTKEPGTGPSVGDLSDKVEAESTRERVFTVLRDADRQLLPEGQSVFLEIGDGVDVDEVGRARLNFVGENILFQVEVLRDGELVIQELAEEDRSVSIELLQNGGTFFNQFNAQDEIDQRITIRTDFAEITASGTEFLVVKEANTPLEWVIGLDSVAEDLNVLAEGITKDVVSGQTRWIAPVGEPSAGIDAQMDGVQEWLDRLQAGESVQEIGQVVWDFATISTNMSVVTDIPDPGEFIELKGGIQLSRQERGAYGLRDCNQDGVDDIVISDGVINFDFRNVLARVQSLDLTVSNLGSDHAGVLRLYNPAFAQVEAVPLEVGAGQGQILSAGSDQAVHYASLEMEMGCLLGVSVSPPDTPPQSNGALMAEITDIYLEGVSYIVEFATFGFQPKVPGQHVHFFFNTVPPKYAGVPSKEGWVMYGGPSPFSEYTRRHKPANATQMCILVANPDHTVQLNSGNCYDLPHD